MARTVADLVVELELIRPEASPVVPVTDLALAFLVALAVEEQLPSAARRLTACIPRASPCSGFASRF